MRTNIIIMHKVSTDLNLSEAVTKGLEASGIQKYLEGLGKNFKYTDTDWFPNPTATSRAPRTSSKTSESY